MSKNDQMYMYSMLKREQMKNEGIRFRVIICMSYVNHKGLPIHCHDQTLKQLP